MRITKIEIFGYGKWVDKTVHLTPELNILSGRNGSGKSTLMSFVLSVLFGFPNMRKKNQREYDINEENHFGGRLHLTETVYGDVTIERTRKNGKQLLYMMLPEDEDKVLVDNFDRLLNGLSKQDYLNYFGFTEADLMDFIWESEEDFAKSLVSLGVSGRKVLNDITPSLKAEAEQIYKPNGKNPVLNQQLNALEESAGHLDRASQDEANYYALEKQYYEDTARLTELRQQQDIDKSFEIQLELATQQQATLREYKQLEQELSANDFTPIEDEDLRRWDQIQTRLVELEEEQQAFGYPASANPSEEIGEHKRFASDAGMDWIAANSEVVEIMYAESKAYRNHLRQNGDVNEELIKKRYEKNRLLKIMGVDQVDELPIDLTTSEREEWQRRYRNVQNKQRLIANENKEGSPNQQKLAELQAEEEELRAEYEALRREGSPERSWLITFGLILSGFGLVLLILGFLMSSAFFTASGGAAIVLGLIFSLVGTLNTQSSKKNYREDIKAYELDFIDIKQERDDILKVQQQQSVEKDQLDDAMEDLLDELETLAVEKGGQDYIETLSWIEEDYVTQIKTLDEEIIHMELLLNRNNFTKDQENHWADYRQQLGREKLSEEDLYHQFENDYLTWREELSRQDYALFESREQEKRQQRLTDSIRLLQEQKQTLMQKFDVANQQELKDKVRKQQQTQEKQNRFTILSNHLDLSLLPYLEDELPIDVQLANKQERVKQTDEEIDRLVDRISQTKSEIKRLTASGRMRELIHEDDAIYHQALDSAVEWAARQIAVNIFEEATLGETGDANNLVMSHAIRYIHDLTDGKFSKLRFNTDGVNIYSEQTGWLPVAQLSRGEKALLFIAMRFAFLNAQLGQIELPIFIDEAFAHLDEAHKDNVYRFLTERGLDNQIILLTTDTYFPENLKDVAIQEI